MRRQILRSIVHQEWLAALQLKSPDEPTVGIREVNKFEKEKPKLSKTSSCTQMSVLIEMKHHKM